MSRLDLQLPQARSSKTALHHSDNSTATTYTIIHPSYKSVQDIDNSRLSQDQHHRAARYRSSSTTDLLTNNNTVALDPDRISISTSRSFQLQSTEHAEKQPLDYSPYRSGHNDNSDQHSPSATAPADSSDPPPFSSHNFPSLYFPEPSDTAQAYHNLVTDCAPESLPAFAAPAPPFEAPSSSSVGGVIAETKAALPRDTKDGSSSKDIDDGEPPPPYTEGSSPLDGFTYVMAAAGGAASIITQVSQGGPAPINTLAGQDMTYIEVAWWDWLSIMTGVSDEHITLDLRYDNTSTNDHVRNTNQAQRHTLHPLPRRAPNPPRIRPPLPIPQRSSSRWPHELLPRR